MAAITPPNPNPSLSANPTPFHPRTTFLHRFTLPISSNPKKRHPFLSISNVISNPKPTTTTTNTPSSPEPFVSRYAPDQPRKGSDVLVEALEREGVTDVFAYPIGASMDIHQSLTCSRIIRNFLPRHEQGIGAGGFDGGACEED
ncbi:hypothetical protein L6452_00800 [Arctium lappa]|uniref:Uncharacterized protein n=1 Tax=Arctium lappa TaxID=4217 RepID=A0ACB9FFR2_ARCLA|nr:hypothetical protein L6452_00800 [Arctium lappa]